MSLLIQGAIRQWADCALREMLEMQETFET